jgi:hypothetical protein
MRALLLSIEPPKTGIKAKKQKNGAGGSMLGRFPMESRAGIYSLFRNSDRAGWYLPLVRRSHYSLAGTVHRRRSPLLKTGFFRLVRGLKIQRKNPGHALRLVKTSRYEK